jgi:hypothetical protein
VPPGQRPPSGKPPVPLGDEMPVDSKIAETGVEKWHLKACALTTAAVFLSLLIDSFARYPVPGPNEPHYLCKAKHYWDPDWCARDLFLSSSNAHLVFYQTFGWLTRWFSLETTAIVGRLVGLLILAIGWTAMVRAVVPGKWGPPLWACWIFLALQAVGNLSGEWLVGGIESKIVAYGLLFAAMALCMNRERRRSWHIAMIGLLFGVAISFHPVVGIWGLSSTIIASLVTGYAKLRRLSAETSPESGSHGRVRWWSVAAVFIGLLAAAPGILAGLKAAAGSSPVADYIQVYYRLAHHLDPLHFGVEAQHFWESPWFQYGLLALVWLTGRRWMSRRQGESWFVWFVVGSGLIALCGLIDGLRTGPPEKMIAFALRWKFLKLYPFRLFDAMLPIAAAITIAGVLRHWCEHACLQPENRGRRTLPLIWVLCALPALIAVLNVAPDARPQMSNEELADWRDTCRWIERNTPPDALILTPVHESWTFKWYAQRAEFVNYKDCPQDGPGILEWNNRLLFIGDWSEKHYEQGFTRADVAPLHERYGIGYIVAKNLGPFRFPPVFENSTFRIYRLDDKVARGRDAR